VISGRGYEADLRLIGDDATGGMARAFVDGSRIAYLALAGFILIALVGAIRTRDPERAKDAAPAVKGAPDMQPRLAGAAGGRGAAGSGGGTG
jgi:hypothetical protein